ncbi:MAG: hypothetical protein J6Y02_05865 [Pseudobutyrivibrio sp.]|nr:hypothetical protein [Pseudobutyrivibrio sp.]
MSDDNELRYAFAVEAMNSQLLWAIRNMDILKKQEEMRRNCEAIEYEQDMNASIPFCKLDGKMCNCQCMGGYR